MTTLRTAAQQALEALIIAWQQQPRWQITESMHALRAALAQQDDPTDPGHDVDVLREHVRHLERRVRELHAQQAEPVEPVAWECKAGGLKALTQRQYDAQPLNIRRRYTRIAPPQRLPLTEEEIEHIGMTHQSLRQVVRAVEKASWEKNHG